MAAEAAGAAGGNTMKSRSTIAISMKTPLLFCAILTFAFPGLAAFAAPAAEQKGFDTPKLAADALIQAAENFDVPALKEILGPESEDIVSSEDAVQDKNRAVAFAAIARVKSSIEVDPKNPNSATLSVGNEDWPLPIPIVKRSGKWYFDTKAGREEILRSASEQTSWMSSRFATGLFMPRKNTRRKSTMVPL